LLTSNSKLSKIKVGAYHMAATDARMVITEKYRRKEKQWTLILSPFTSDKFMWVELNFHNNLSKKGSKQQNRDLKLQIHQ
jgi:hypothetical protein